MNQFSMLQIDGHGHKHHNSVILLATIATPIDSSYVLSAHAHKQLVISRLKCATAVAVVQDADAACRVCTL